MILSYCKHTAQYIYSIFEDFLKREGSILKGLDLGNSFLSPLNEIKHLLNNYIILDILTFVSVQL